MKKTLFALLSIAFLTACHPKEGGNVSDQDNGNDPKKITRRDRSINASNAYNDIFFDSLALVNFIKANRIETDMARRMTSFYNARNYQYAWFFSAGLSEQARGFWNMYRYYLGYGGDSSLKDQALQEKMDELIGADSLKISSADKTFLNTELKLTNHFIAYTLSNFDNGAVKRKEMEKFIPLRRVDALMLADSLISKKHKDNKYYEDVNESYKKLKEQLVRYVAIARSGGWPLVNSSAKRLIKGNSGAVVSALKKRLSTTGEMASNDTTAVFDDGLEQGIKNFQLRFGYKPTGRLTDNQLKDMNIPVLKRVQQLLMNLGRTQWLINEPQGKLIMVNIPEFILHVKDGKNKVFDMDVVVGKEGHNTTMFTGNLNQIVFSPYWNIPASIVKKEILPAMNKNKHYLASHDMEITGTRGGLPVVRQLPGPKNSLGKVKFLFPNSFDIYFHDTPAKSLFDQDKRAYSHGCIRLSEPAKFAAYLLKDDTRWNAAKIDSAMNSGKQNFVKVKDPVPVLITYYTAWVDDNGQLHFADDIYGHDAALAEKMFL